LVTDNGLNGPQGVAVDTAGNVYVADTGNNRVLQLPPG
jgi:serine/threonine-protein kinase